jgi:hypothetical protein
MLIPKGFIGFWFLFSLTEQYNTLFGSFCQSKNLTLVFSSSRTGQAFDEIVTQSGPEGDRLFFLSPLAQHIL